MLKTMISARRGMLFNQQNTQILVNKIDDALQGLMMMQGG